MCYMLSSSFTLKPGNKETRHYRRIAAFPPAELLKKSNELVQCIKSRAKIHVERKKRSKLLVGVALIVSIAGYAKLLSVSPCQVLH